jgi:hypothetical protein
MKEIFLEQKVNDLLKSDAITPATRNAFEKRIKKASGRNHFFPDEMFRLLSVVCDRLMDQDSNNRLVNVALFIDDRLSKNDCDGWRYNEMPPDAEMLLMGLHGIDETAREMFGKEFILLPDEQQIAVITAIQQNVAHGNTWKSLSANRFFEDLLAEATEIFFSYPAVQIKIKYAGMADAKGWEKTGLGESEKTEKWMEGI